MLVSSLLAHVALGCTFSFFFTLYYINAGDILRIDFNCHFFLWDYVI